MHEPDLLDKAIVPERGFGDVLDQLADYPHDKFPAQALAVSDADMPASIEVEETILSDWSASAHAEFGANCSACHLEEGASKNTEDLAWSHSVSEQSCAQCHSTEVERFHAGKHGMRLAAGLPPMTPALARLPMKDDAAHRELGCHSCHDAHDYNTKTAAVDACLTCHNDDHSVAYLDSPHYALWQNELANPDTHANTGVSCATCHMPRIDYDVSDWVSRTIVDHNQSANFAPNTKMIRTTCMHCHGLEFSINAVSDPALVTNNFSGYPSVVVDSMRLAKELEESDRQRRQNNQ